MADNKVTSFRRQMDFLSNFYRAWFTTPKGTKVETVEHAFQACKTLDPAQQRWVLDANTPLQAKQRGKAVQLRPDWDKVKYSIMRALVFMKFDQNPDLANKLLATGDSELIEGNRWHDNYWGDCECPRCSNRPGRNLLGKALMEVRAELRNR